MTSKKTNDIKIKLKPRPGEGEVNNNLYIAVLFMMMQSADWWVITTYQTMQHHTTKVHNMNLYHSEDLKSQIASCT